MGSSSTNGWLFHSPTRAELVPPFASACRAAMVWQTSPGTLQLKLKPLPIPHQEVPHEQEFWALFVHSFPGFSHDNALQPALGASCACGQQQLPGSRTSPPPPQPLLKGWGKNKLLLPLSGFSAISRIYTTSLFAPQERLSRFPVSPGGLHSTEETGHRVRPPCLSSCSPRLRFTFLPS